jgi:translation initiation factor 1
MDIFIGSNLDELPLSKQGSADEKITPQKIMPKQKHQLVMQFQKRNGKPVSLIGRFFLENSELKALAKKLKSNLACGGSIEDEWILLQGDVREKAKKSLQNWGWIFKN